MTPDSRATVVRLIVAAQLAAVANVACYWHGGGRFLPREFERPMEGVTVITFFALPVAGFVAPGIGQFTGWRLTGLLLVEAGIGLAFVVAMLPTVQ